MKNYRFWQFFLLLILLGRLEISLAQEKKDEKKDDFEEEFRKQRELFNKTKKAQKMDFREYRQKLNELFFEALRQNWRKYTPTKPRVITDSLPKPDTQPTAKSTEITQVPNQKVTQVKTQEIKPLDNTIPKKTFEPSISKIEVKPETKPETEQNYLSVNYFETDLQIPYNQDFKINLPTTLNENQIADYWQKMTEKDYLYFLQQILKYRNQMNLNDWAYYRLLQSIANQISKGDKNEARLFTWFMLLQSGYKARIGHIDNQIFLLLPTQSIIYRNTYFKFDNLFYYVMDSPRTVNLFIYEKDFPEAQNIISLEIPKNLKINEKTATRKLTFKHLLKEYSVNLTYSLGIIDLYKDYPLTDPAIFFRASPNEITRKSLRDNLLPLLKGKTELEAVNFLLSMVQKGLEYKTDDEQFGREKPFFVEEVLYYPYADCEDRSVFFAFLVKDLLGLEVVGLDYPAHISTAIKFNQAVSGDFCTIKDQKYLICDPTYIGAPAGKAMDSYKNITAGIIK